MPSTRIAALALGADAVAVVVFAAIGRTAHAESGDLLGLLGTAAPFLIGLGAAWATPMVRAHPAGLRAGAVVVAGSALIGLVVRAGFTGSLPLVFALIAMTSLAVLMLGWRALSLAVAHRAAQRVR
ncbi:MAG TPA: DUF3054 domain-containing protein [Pseudonocardia sp.]|nr:DUF3054 domain-containing protein [Pseudonocardia sp.]